MSIDSFFSTLKASTTEAGAVGDAAAAEGAVAFNEVGQHGALFMLDVTAAADDVDDTLNVTVEGSLDGTNFFEILSFAEVLGNGGAIQHYEPIQLGSNAAGFIGSDSLAAGAQVAVLAAQYRVRWSIVDPAGADSCFTFSGGVHWQ